MNRRTLALLGLLFAGACATAGPSAPVMSAPVRAVVDSPPLDQVHWGILAVDRESGETLLSRRHSAV